MIKKIITLIVLTLLIAGCTNEYTIEIKDGKIKESYLVSIPVITETEECKDAYPECDIVLNQILSMNLFPFITKEKGDYNKKNYGKDDKRYSLRTYDFDYENYAYSYALNECFDSKEYTYEKGIINIHASGFTQCYMDFDVTIKVKTNYKVYEHNADKKEGNTYIWYIDAENYNTKDLMIRVKAYSLIPYIIWSVMGIGVISTIYYLYKKTQKVNEIN